MMAVIRAKQVKSAIGYPKDQKATVKGLGFRRLQQTVELEDTASIRGMLNKVKHLVKIEEAS
ncbi:MAG: 50S ribosomal protein L30 [Mariprofundaceae bacterium]|nr:50S ribosomal protein L30 [Mariprofundaceae bacterium]